MIERLFPINRSLTGEGVRKSLKILKETADFDIKEIPSGTKVFDWEIPKEWNITNATLETPKRKIVDFKVNNLCVLGYSTPVDKEIKFDELDKHLHTDPNHPGSVPYRTSYYKEDWGFCVSDKIKNGWTIEETCVRNPGLDRNATYHAKIDSTLEPGSMTYGERELKGDSGKEYLIATYSCHPSMYQDNLSGMIVWSKVLAELQKNKTHHSYHFFIGPETIGMISLLARKHDFDGAILINNCGRHEDISVKQSFAGNTELDKVVEETLKENKIRHKNVPFSVNGSDERQLSSPAFRIPAVSLNTGDLYDSARYHNSADDLSTWLTSLSEINTTPTLEKNLDRMAETYLKVIDNLERNRGFQTLSPHCEPMLGKHDLYPSTGGNNQKDDTSTIAKWIMHEGKGRLLNVAKRTGLPLGEIHRVANKLEREGLIKWKE